MKSLNLIHSDSVASQIHFHQKRIILSHMLVSYLSKFMNDSILLCSSFKSKALIFD